MRQGVGGVIERERRMISGVDIDKERWCSG